MYAAGIDVGTTTVCGVLLDAKSGRVERVITLDNDASFPGKRFEDLQDPERIWELAEGIYRDFRRDYPKLSCIGFTGQMHGILYVNREGRAVSPLFTWQDERGNEPYPGGEGETYAEAMSRLTGYPMASGYGLTTHFYNLRNGLVPKEAVSFCTIADYLGMRLTGRNTPCLSVSNGASLGCFDLAEMAFDGEALARAGIPPEILPQCQADCGLLGQTGEGIPVSTGIGDNQASVLGAVRELEGSVLINIGTASQISAGLTRYVETEKTELRAICRDQYLLVGAGLCGGRAYAALERFFPPGGGSSDRERSGKALRRYGPHPEGERDRAYLSDRGHPVLRYPAGAGKAGRDRQPGPGEFYAGGLYPGRVGRYGGGAFRLLPGDGTAGRAKAGASDRERQRPADEPAASENF